VKKEKRLNWFTPIMGVLLSGFFWFLSWFMQLDVAMRSDYAGFTPWMIVVGSVALTWVMTPLFWWTNFSRSVVVYGGAWWQNVLRFVCGVATFAAGLLGFFMLVLGIGVTK